MQSLPAPLAAMAAYRQFMCYALVPSTTEPGKMDKLPMSPHTGQVCSAHDPAAWTTAEHACQVATAWGSSFGVAFVFTAQDPFWFVDIDKCRLPDGSWSPIAHELIGMFPGAAVEISQSGNGLHIFGCGTAPPHAKKNAALKLEFYTELRFVALTGTFAQGNVWTDHTVALHTLTARYFEHRGDAGGVFELTDEPVPEWRGPTDDADLLRRAMNSRSVGSTFGSKASFADLYDCNVEVLARIFPPNKAGEMYDASGADAALISHLAFWTGRDGERVHRLMQGSALKRAKWDREDYLPRSISEILARPGDVLTDKEPEPPPTAVASVDAPRQQEVTGATFMAPGQQIDLFKGCVYVTGRHKVLTPGGTLLKPEVFKATYGGYVFAMDAINERVTRNAFEAFTESNVLRPPRADSVCFRPDLTPGAIVDIDGRKLANTYWPATVRRAQGDITPFMNHLRKLLPDDRDREMMLCYMAACVQHKGVKFQWAPVVQGAEGNGKSLLSRCVARALGSHFTEWLNATQLASQFNQWLSNKLLICVEELYDPEHQRELEQQLLTMLAGGDGLQIQAKGVDQESMSICANFMFNTNKKNAVRKTVDTARRFGNFFTAQQSRADIERDGMGGDYFPKLWSWLRADGFAIVADLLHIYPIAPEFNPAGAAYRAPITSTTDAAIRESQGSVEQFIAEAIAQDTPGFMGGWISSVKLDVLLSETLKIGNKLSLSKREEMLKGMGYLPHPGLPDGRVNNPVMPDGKRSKLFVTAGHSSIHMRAGAEIARAYSAAQSIAVMQRP